MNYKETIENRIPEMARDYTEDWDGYGSKPASKIAIDRAIEILKKLEKYNIDCPSIYAISNGDVEMLWVWYGHNKKDRKRWTLTLTVSENSIDDQGDCLFFEFNAKEGIESYMKDFDKQKESFYLYFNHEDDLPEGMINKLNELEEWKKLN